MGQWHPGAGELCGILRMARRELSSLGAPMGQPQDQGVGTPVALAILSH